MDWGKEGSEEGLFDLPHGMAVDSSGNVYVADTGNYRIQKFDYNGTFMLGWGSEGTDDGQFKLPKGIAVAADGIVYVADTDNNRIQKFSQRDNDGDGLPNSVELVISTDPNNRDSDFDLLNDSYEVRNMSIGTDPLKADSNGDGLGDYFEVKTTNVSLDVDGDGIPNAWDSDNDGDGVVDGLDRSPFSKSTINNKSHFDIKTNGNATYIDLQIRPKNPEHLKLPLQSWDWPYDDKGQIKDLDYSKDDVQIQPMLELNASQVPAQSQVNDYGIVVTEGYYKIVNKHNGKCVNVDIGHGDGNNICQWDYLGLDWQKWKLEPVDDGWYKIINKHNGKCVNVDIGHGDGNNICQWEYAGLDWQKWKLEPVGDGWYKIINKHSGKCVNVDIGHGDGNNICQWDYLGLDWQKWKLELVEYPKAYVPLTPVQDYGTTVAFNGRMFYPASAPLNLSADARLVWMVNDKVDKQGDLSWSPTLGFEGGFSAENAGGGAAIVDINGNGKPDLLLMGIDNPQGDNNFRYKIGWDLKTDGNPTSWSPTLGFEGGFSAENAGGGAAIADINGNGKPDLLLMGIDNPQGQNNFRYKIGWDLKTDGNPTSWSPTLGYVGGFGVYDAGGGAAIVDINGNGKPDLLLMGIDNPEGDNNFRYKIGWDLESESTTIARYKEDFMLTGFSVEENSGADAGLFYSGDRNQTMNAYLVLKYEFLKSQNTLLEAPAKLAEHNVSVTSNISSYSHHDAALIAVLNKTKDALDSLPEGKILPIVFALSDVSANSAMGTPYIQGNEYNVDLTNRSVVTTKSIKMSWYNTTTNEIIGFDELIGDVKIWEGDDIEKKANMLMLLLIASFGETTLPGVDGHEIEFEDPEENEVLEWMHKGYSGFEHLAGPLIEIIAKSLEKRAFLHARYAIMDGLTGEMGEEANLSPRLGELTTQYRTVKATKNMDELKAVMSEGAIVEEAGWASKLSKIAEVMEVVGWIIIAAVAIYTFIAIAKAEGWSGFGFALGAVYAVMQLIFVGILVAIGCIPVVGWAIALLIVIADIIASIFGHGSGWLMKKLIDWLVKFIIRVNLELEPGGTTLNIEDYDDNGLTVGDKIEIKSWFWAKASETKRGIDHGDHDDYKDSYIHPKYEYHKDDSTFESGSYEHYCDSHEDHDTWYKEKCYTGLWLMPNKGMKNLPLTSWLSANYKFYYDECILGICSGKSNTSTTKTDPDTTYFDVLPGNIGDFVNWYAISLQDTDGDGLLNSVEGHQDTYYKICAEHSGKCLDVKDASTASSANVEQWEYEGKDNQKWKLEPVGDGYHKICAKHSGKCLSIEDGGTYNGANVVQKTYGGYTDQKWRLDHVGGEGNYKIINNRSSKCLNVSHNSTANGANVWQWDWWNKEDQKWKLVPVECDTSANKWDTDSDGLSDMFEVHTFGYDISPTKADTDSDGLTDMLELELGTDPTEKDTDSDGLTDYEEHRGWQITFNYLGDPGKEFSETVWSDPRINDTDFDGLTDYVEYMLWLNPRSEDTNGDGISDNDAGGTPTSWSSSIHSPYTDSYFNAGGGAVIADINGNGKPDLLLMGIDDPSGANQFRYMIGWDIDTDGNPSSWSSSIHSPYMGSYFNAGGGAVIADINGNGKPDLLLMGIDDPDGANQFRYMIGWDIDTDGNPTSWSSSIHSPYMGSYFNAGGGAVIADINGNGTLDLLLMGINDSSGANHFRYMIGWDIDTDGNPGSWSSVIKSSAIGNENAGGGAAIADINGNGKPDLLLMGIDDPEGANKFWYMIGWDIDTNGNPSSWSSTIHSPVTGTENDGGGAAIADINGNGKQDWLLMAIGNPEGANQFGYMIGWDIKTGESETTSSGGIPVGASQKAESATQDTDNDGLTDETETTGWDVTFTNSTGTYTLHVTSESLLKDTDFDGLNDHEEFNARSNPRNVDTDGDGLSDYVEKELGTAVTNYDIDGDGLDDGTEITCGSDPKQSDTDGDGLSDFGEFVLGSDPNNRDTDSDGLSDSQEKQFNSSLCNPDSDADLLFDAQEYNLSTDPWNPDSDSDNLTDGYEIIHNTSALNNDTDFDGVPDGYEIELWTDPLCNDTDGDDISDLRELELGTDPLWNDTDDDGVNDLEDTDSYVPHVARVILAYDPDADTYEFVDKLAQYTNVTIVSPDELKSNYSDAPYIVLVGRPDGNGTAGNITRDILIKSGDNTTLTAMLESDYDRFAVEYGVWTPTQTVVMLTQPYHSDHYRILSTLKGMKVTRLPDSVVVEYPSTREFFSIEAIKEIESSVRVELEEAVTPWVKMSRYNVSTTPSALSHTGGLRSEEETAGQYLEITVNENVQNETSDIINWAWIGMYYTVSDLDRTGDGDADDAGDLNESTLSLYSFDKSGWTKLSEGTGVDTTNVVLYGKDYEGYVWANVSHLGLHGLAGEKRSKPIVPTPTPAVRGGGGGGGGGGPQDTDGDGISDLDELIAGTDPNDPCDPNHDCVACLAIRRPARTPAATPSSVPVATSAPEPTPVEAPEGTPAATPKPRIPGFEVALLLIAFAVVTGYLRRVKMRKL